MDLPHFQNKRLIYLFNYTLCFIFVSKLKKLNDTSYNREPVISW